MDGSGRIERTANPVSPALCKFAYLFASRPSLMAFFILGGVFLAETSFFTYALSAATPLLHSTGGSGSGEPHVPGVFFRQFLPVSPKASDDLQRILNVEFGRWKTDFSFATQPGVLEDRREQIRGEGSL